MRITGFFFLLMGILFSPCFGSNPPAPKSVKPRVLIMCTGNSCRSQMAEGWGRHLWGSRYDFSSAGVLKKGLNLIGYTSLPKVDNLKVTQYLSGARWVNVYSYNPDPGVGYQWAKPSGTIGSATVAANSPLFDVDISGAPVLKLGKGYWVTADTDTVVSP